ncbi:MAG: hypothetical protein HQK65_12245, partial [Desulfamplus sp.]|nr:hypothetical protein [Desulfamplus sp.]
NSGVIQESDETDNSMAVQLAVTTPVTEELLPDLTFKDGTSATDLTPPALEPGRTVTVSGGLVLNQGIGAATPFYCDYYLSGDKIITKDDIRLGGFDIQKTLASGESTQLPESLLTIPSTTLPGEYFIGILIDGTDAVAESNEGNNSFTIVRTIVVMDITRFSLKSVTDSIVKELLDNEIAPLFTTPSLKPMPVPAGKKILTLFPSSSASVNEDPSAASVIGLGSVAYGGDTLSLKIKLGQFSGKVDLYLALSHETDDSRANLFFISENGSLHSFDSTPLGQWKKGVTGPVSELIFGDIPAGSLPTGRYTIFLLATPAGKAIGDNYYLWSSSFEQKSKWLESELNVYYPDWKKLLVKDLLPGWIGDLITSGDLTITSTNPVQVLDGAPLAQGKGTMFRVTVKSSFLTSVSASFKLSLGTIPFEMWKIVGSGLWFNDPDWPEIWGPVVIKPGINEIMLPYIPAGRENNEYSYQTDPAGILEGAYYFGTFHPDKRALPAPVANYCSYTVSVDPDNKITESNENNNSLYKELFAAPVKGGKFLFVPVYQKPNSPPRISRVYSVAKKSIEYIMGTFPVPDAGITWSVASATTVQPCSDNASQNCGYAAVWEEGVGRGEFFSQLLPKEFKKDYNDPYYPNISPDEFDFIVAVTSGSGGGAGGSDKVVAIGDQAGDQILAHEFTHAVIGVYDIYSADCLVGWDEAYCEHSDGSREYCCIDGLDADHPKDYYCVPDASGTIQCDYSTLLTKNCSQTCTDFQSCRNKCSSICSDGNVFSGPDARLRHPSSRGFWTTKWLEIDGPVNYFMDARIESGASYPWMWNVLGNTTYHCYWGFGPVDNPDGYINILNHPRFKKP